MKHDPRSTAHDEDAFEPEERPTRPSPPKPEHLRALRSASEPPRARLAARRRPALTAATQSWLATQARAKPPTHTSRWRSMAATVLGGGSGRESRLDPSELAPAVTARSAAEVKTGATPALVRTEVMPATRMPPVERPSGPGGTLRMPPVLGTGRLSEPAVTGEPLDATDGMAPVLSARARRFRWLVAGCAGLLCAMTALAILGGNRAAPPPAPVAGLVSPSPIQTQAPPAPVALDPAPPSPAPPATAASPPDATPAPPASTYSPAARSSNRHAAPRRSPPSTSSSIF